MPGELGSAQTLDELAGMLVDDFDVAAFLHTLALASARLLGAADAVLMLTDGRGGVRGAASSSERARLVEVFELRNNQGPCLDCFRNGQPVIAKDLADLSDRWPLFAVEAMKTGFRLAYAVPLRFRDQVIGALILFRTQPGALDEADLGRAEAMADMATIGILQQRAVQEAKRLAGQLQCAFDEQVVIEQAKGMLAERAQINLEDALRLLGYYARRRRMKLNHVAEALIAGKVGMDELGPARRFERRRTR